MNKLSFATKAAANEFLASQKNLYQHSTGYSPVGMYSLAHGEHSAPDFKPVRYKDGWGIKKVHYFYPSTCHAPKDGRCNILNGELVLQTSL